MVSFHPAVVLDAMAKVQTPSTAVPGNLPDWLVRELRSDHAGETGAVYIYRGILAVSRQGGVCGFADRHLVTERQHLALIENLLPRHARSWLLPVWRLAGFLTGAVPAIFGARAVYATIAAVEEFVDRHYQQQIDRLRREGICLDIAAQLERCREDEVAHRDESRQRLDQLPANQAGWLLRGWCRLVGAGSAVAVGLARWR